MYEKRREQEKAGTKAAWSLPDGSSSCAAPRTSYLYVSYCLLINYVAARSHAHEESRARGAAREEPRARSRARGEPHEEEPCATQIVGEVRQSPKNPLHPSLVVM